MVRSGFFRLQSGLRTVYMYILGLRETSDKSHTTQGINTRWRHVRVGGITYYTAHTWMSMLVCLVVVWSHFSRNWVSEVCESWLNVAHGSLARLKPQTQCTQIRRFIFGCSKVTRRVGSVANTVGAVAAMNAYRQAGRWDSHRPTERQTGRQGQKMKSINKVLTIASNSLATLFHSGDTYVLLQ